MAARKYRVSVPFAARRGPQSALRNVLIHIILAWVVQPMRRGVSLPRHEDERTIERPERPQLAQQGRQAPMATHNVLHDNNLART